TAESFHVVAVDRGVCPKAARPLQAGRVDVDHSDVEVVDEMAETGKDEAPDRPCPEEHHAVAGPGLRPTGRMDTDRHRLGDAGGVDREAFGQWHERTRRSGDVLGVAARGVEPQAVEALADVGTAFTAAVAVPAGDTGRSGDQRARWEVGGV